MDQFHLFSLSAVHSYDLYHIHINMDFYRSVRQGNVNSYHYCYLSRYQDADDDCAFMESSFSQIEKEETRRFVSLINGDSACCFTSQ